MSSPIDRLKQTFAAACDQHSIQGRLAGSPGALEVTFTAQEGANEAMMLHGFGEELRSAGVDWAEMAADAGPDEATLTRYEAGVRGQKRAGEALRAGKLAQPIERTRSEDDTRRRQIVEALHLDGSRRR